MIESPAVKIQGILNEVAAFVGESSSLLSDVAVTYDDVMIYNDIADRLSIQVAKMEKWKADAARARASFK